MLNKFLFSNTIIRKNVMLDQYYIGNFTDQHKIEINRLRSKKIHFKIKNKKERIVYL